MTRVETQPLSELAIWWRWFLASVIGCTVGIGSGAFIALALGKLLSENRTLSNGYFLVIVCFGAGNAGGLLGLIQERTLGWYNDFVEAEDITGWWLASSIGAVIGGIVVLGLYDSDRPWWQLQDLVRGTGYVGVALIIAVWLSMPQWWLIRRIAPGTGWWVLWNVAAAALICLVPLITTQPVWIMVISILIYSVITACGILWLRFVIHRRNGDDRLRMSRRNPATTYAWLGTLIYLLLFMSCGISTLYTPSSSIPSYPRSENVVISTSDPEKTFINEEITRFTTDDLPIDVLVFYRNRLANRGWRYVTSVVDPVQGWRSLTFTDSGCPYVTLTITATVSLDQHTAGELLRSSQGCY